jgi:hypothetical protein
MQTTNNSPDDRMLAEGTQGDSGRKMTHHDLKVAVRF